QVALPLSVLTAGISEVSTLSLHDALPIFGDHRLRVEAALQPGARPEVAGTPARLPRVVAAEVVNVRERQRLLAALHLDLEAQARSEEHTSALQSREKLVCRLLLEKKHGPC